MEDALKRRDTVQGGLMAEFILAVDQGTTSSRAIVFDGTYRVRGVAQQEFPQHFPRSGWVEHDPEDMWRTVLGHHARARWPTPS